MRTEISNVKQSRSNGKWYVEFSTFRGQPGKEYLASQLISGAHFNSEDAAWEAGRRAMDLLEETEMFPNLCEPF